MPEPFRMTHDELNKLNEDGYVVRENVFTVAECRRMAEDVEQLERDCLAAKRNSKIVYGSYMFEIQRELLDWAHDPRLWNPSKDVVGQDELSLFTEKTTMKRAHTGGTIVLHQDYPYWRNMTKVAHKIMTALIYLDDATVENGCLEVSPGSHRDGMRMGRKMVDGFGSNELDEAKFDMHTLIPVEAPAGTVVYFGAFLVHRSLPNRSAADRRALLYSYQPGGYPSGVEINRLLAKARQQQSVAAQ
jgi:ectoine hydroxylase-related dioxygenase (phytanoyl-CoA dioxygenase family)